MHTIDCRGMQCPKPVLEARKYLLANPGVGAVVLVGDDIAQANVTRLATTEGYAVQSQNMDDHIRLTLTLQEGLECQTPPVDNSVKRENQPTVAPTQNPGNIVYIASNCMGKGSDELGEILMRNFVFTLCEVEPLPKAILFVNSAVKLTCTDSQVLEPLQHLEQQGVKLASCGLCLEYFELKGQLKVGEVSNMLDIIEAMTAAGKIVQP
ncbi:MAG: sulfurtransferase-like selenium metabolism protein YedF [Desulfuromonadaceae bacterium]|nr:sulfurtransferase-like selenium metabolism protein YedF [Desulfuromonas sp.]MDY0185246.1 sulfurtransferase-like selenium metabolism protein YedF [Desulfuromonadaceae bacterium]